MWKRLAGIAVLIGSLACANGAVLKVEGYVDGGEETDSLIWFSLEGIDQRFVVNALRTSNADEIWQAIEESNKQNQLLTVRFDPDTAEMDEEHWVPTFVVRSVTWKGKTVSGDEATFARSHIDELAPAAKAEFALARGIAYANAGETKVAQPLLDEALKPQSALPKPLLPLAYKTRGNVYQDQAGADWPPGNDRDRLLVTALGDARAWKQLAPDDQKASMAVASNLSLLGAYDEALKAYESIVTRWPKDTFWPLIRIASLHREKGDPAGALDEISRVAALPGGRDSMPYHYHRGWALHDLGRYEEAISEFTEGLKIQPDWAGAVHMRACALAALGRLPEALADHRAARKAQVEFLSTLPPSAGRDFDMKRYAEVEQLLAAAVERDPSQKIAGLCQGYWNWGYEPRSRSKLLPE